MGFFSSLFGGGIGALSIKHQISSVQDINGNDVLIKGNIYPISYSNVPSRCKISFDITLKDRDSTEPILSKIPDLQMGPGWPAFCYSNPGPYISKDMGFEDWTTVGFIPDEEHLISPYKGSRNVDILFQCLTEDNIILSQVNTEKLMYFDECGYLELNQQILKTQAIAIRLAIDIACSDGTLDKEEKDIIKAYAKQKIDIVGDEFKTEVKKRLNNAIKTGVEKAENRKVNRKKLTSEIKEKSDLYAKEDLLNLCLDVMAGDGVADNNELRILEEIATDIGFDYKQFMSLRDKRMIGLKTMSEEEDLSDIKGMERSLGIKSEWTVKEKIKHCKKEFRKWNGRLGSLKEKQKQKNAQKILDMIGVLLQHYEK